MLFQKKQNKKIKKWEVIVLLVLISVGILFKIYQNHYPKNKILLGDDILNVLVSDTESHKFKGLSDRENLSDYDGMLFLFSNTSQHAVVMRKMNFPIDIVWVKTIVKDGDSCELSKFSLRKFVSGIYMGCTGEIIDIAPNVQIEPGKQEKELIPYFSRESSSVVLELPAGFALENGLKIGDRYEFLD